MDQDLQNLLELNILKLFDMEQAPEEEQAAFLRGCMNEIFEQVTMRIREELPDDTRQEFADTFKDGEPGERQIAFLEKYVPHLDEMIVSAILAFKKSAQDAVASLPQS